jgi:L,D-peptidoglycan transpeptidase YkuD (ErfK/YbiS/YcfS/YnhG family)
MPFWQRLGESAIGMHTGQLPGYPASHGCVRLPDESARFMFDSTTHGTVVQVVSQWTPPAAKSPMIAKM